MNDRHRTGASGRDRVTGALDRRVRRVDRIGEIPIALEAAALRGESLTRIEELKSAELDRQTREAELADAVMTDDGAPLCTVIGLVSAPQ